MNIFNIICIHYVPQYLHDIRLTLPYISADPAGLGADICEERELRILIQKGSGARHLVRFDAIESTCTIMFRILYCKNRFISDFCYILYILKIINGNGIWKYSIEYHHTY